MSSGVPVEQLALLVAQAGLALPLMEWAIRPLPAAQRCWVRELTLLTLAASTVTSLVYPVAPFGLDWAIEPRWLALALAPGLLSALRWLRSSRALHALPFQQLAVWDGVPAGEADVPSPMVYGVLRPRILLPRGAHAWPAAQLAATRAHELAHVRRHDMLRKAWLTALGLLFGAHPAFHFTTRRWLDDVELAADAQAIAEVPPRSYAQALLDLGSGRVPQAALGARRPFALSSRIEAVLSPPRRPPLWAYLVPALLGAALLSGAAWVPAAAPPAPQDGCLPP